MSPASSTGQPVPLETEAHLAALIDPWLQHMRWRSDFATWRQKRLQSEDYQDETLGQVSQIAGSFAGRRLLDLGCGMGGFAVAASLRGATVTALDYNPAYCAITAVRSDRYNLAIPVFQAAGEALPLPSNTYDIVTAWDVIEHVQQPGQMLAEIARVLRPGGFVFLTAINRFAFRDPHYHLPLINYMPRPLAETTIKLWGRTKGGAPFSDRQRLSEMHYFTYRAFARLARRYGFSTIDLDETRVQRGELAPHRARRRILLQALDRLGLALPLYHIVRALYQGTYRLALIKQEEPING